MFFSVQSQYFFNTDNIINMLIASSVTGIIAVPGTMLLIAGQVDLSVGSGAAFCGVAVATVPGRRRSSSRSWSRSSPAS